MGWKFFWSKPQTKKTLVIPQSYDRKLLGITDIKVMMDLLREMSYALLNQLADLPSKVTDPKWEQTMEDT